MRVARVEKSTRTPLAGAKTYLDLVLRNIEGQGADDDLAVLRRSCCWASSRLDSRFDGLHSLFDTTNWRRSCFVAALNALCLLLAIDDCIQGLIESGRHLNVGARGL